MTRRTRLDILLLFLAGMASGTINAVPGGGMGVTMLASPGLIEASEDHHRLDAMTTILSVGTAAATLAVFSTGGAVGCPQGTVMLLAVVAGGRGGGAAARRLPEAVVRGTVIAIGRVLTVYSAVP